MVQAIGEGSSSRRRKQKKPRIFSFYENKVYKGEEEVKQSGSILLNLDLLDCPICTKPLTNPIFQCDNGHVTCSCCTKVRYKCPACPSSIGDYRCRLMERIVQSIMCPCPYAKNGCKEKMTRAKVAAHSKECGFCSRLSTRT